MKTLRALSLLVFLITLLVVPSGPGLAAVLDPIPVCIGLKAGGLGSPRIDLTLTASQVGSVFQLNGKAQFSQAIAPPNGLVIYAVSGTAIPNTDGFWVSVAGAGYDLAKSVFEGTFAIQLSADPTKNTLAYAKRSLDGTSTSVVTGAAEVTTCP
jgi:hypothetical protein